MEIDKQMKYIRIQEIGKVVMERRSIITMVYKIIKHFDIISVSLTLQKHLTQQLLFPMNNEINESKLLPLKLLGKKEGF